MFKSEEFGRAFWIDDNNQFKSCPLKVNNEPDFDYIDYVSEWTDLEGINLDKLLYIHHLEIMNKERFGNKITNSDYSLADKKVNQKEVMNTYDEDLYKEIVIDSKFSYGKFNQHNYPIHLQQL